MLYSYLQTIDNGGAPCVMGNLLSLAICKPRIRKHAKVGDHIVSFAAKSMKLNCEKPQIIWMAKVTQVVTMKEYYNLYSERKDCIYDDNLNLLDNPFHCCSNIETDLSGENVLLSDDFVYFGSNHIDVDENFLEIVPKVQGHLSKKNLKYEESFKKYFENFSSSSIKNLNFCNDKKKKCSKK